MDTGRFAVADVVALANKFLRDVSISTDFAIPGGACLPPLVYAIAHICTGVRNTCRASPKFRILVKRVLEFRISGNPVFTCNMDIDCNHSSLSFEESTHSGQHCFVPTSAQAGQHLKQGRIFTTINICVVQDTSAEF